MFWEIWLNMIPFGIIIPIQPFGDMCHHQMVEHACNKFWVKIFFSTLKYIPGFIFVFKIKYSISITENKKMFYIHSSIHPIEFFSKCLMEKNLEVIV